MKCSRLKVLGDKDLQTATLRGAVLCDDVPLFFVLLYFYFALLFNGFAHSAGPGVEGIAFPMVDRPRGRRQRMVAEHV